MTGREGAFEGLDYRGVPVLAALRSIPGTPWALVSKVDQSEVYGPIRRKVWMLEGALLGLVVLAALSLGLFVRQQDADQIQDRMLLEREKRLLSDRYANLMEQASDIILVLDSEGRILEANAQAVAHYGHSLETLRTLAVTDLRAPEALGEVSAQFAKALTGETVRFETVHRRADGTTFPVEVSSRWVQEGGCHPERGPGHHGTQGQERGAPAHEPAVRGPQPGEPGHRLVPGPPGPAGPDLRGDDPVRRIQDGLDRLARPGHPRAGRGGTTRR